MVITPQYLRVYRPIKKQKIWFSVKQYSARSLEIWLDKQCSIEQVKIYKSGKKFNQNLDALRMINPL